MQIYLLAVQLKKNINLNLSNMKSINNYIIEALKLGNKSRYKYHPKTKKELKELLKQLIEERGNDGDFNDINTSEITDMSYLFDKLDFNGIISSWDVSNVTNMSYMFYGCKIFNQDISKWDVSKVNNMRSMFFNCESFNQDISNWDVSNVNDMRFMFCYCGSFNQDISKWNVSIVTDVHFIFDHCPLKQKYKPKFK